MKTALITGVTGQDGSFLTELLLDKGYKVIGLQRRSSVDTHERIRHIEHPNFVIEEGDITDPSSLTGVFKEHPIDECYNLAAQSHVGTSFKQPVYTFQVNAVGVLNLLETIRIHSPKTRFYQASTSEMFGDNYCCEFADGIGLVTDEDKYQDENTGLAPRSPYAVAKTAAHQLVHTYRESYGLHASCGILFNHESERRGEHFVTRKITKWIGEFLLWKNQEFYAIDRIHDNPDTMYLGSPVSFGPAEFPKLRLGNVKSVRDWGYAGDYVEAMWLMLQQDKPDDYVVATGIGHTVEDFLVEAFKYAGLGDWQQYVVIDEKFYRPAEVDFLQGRSNKARTILGWQPKVSFEELVHIMVDNDVQKAKKSKA